MKQKKHDIVQGDIVSYKTSNGETDYLVVVAFMNGTILGKKIYDKNAKPILIRSSLVTYCPAIKAETENLRAFFRCEISASQMTGSTCPITNLFCDKPYKVTLSDLLSALKYGQEVGYNEFMNEWVYYIDSAFSNLYDIGKPENDEMMNNGYRFLPTESDYVLERYNALVKWINEDTQDMREFDKLVKKTEESVRMFELPVPQRAYREEEKIYFIECLDLCQNMLTASDEEIALFRQYIEELCEKGVKTAMRIKAFSCYCGNRAYENDWVQARDLLLALMDEEDLQYIANALGYIYYYGRCNNGVPEYEKAFYYFSIGAAGGTIESLYKVSDMFLHGYAVPKNIQIASDNIDMLYYRTLQDPIHGFFASRFADIALRKGDLVLAKQGDPDEAFYYYLQAEFAIRMRMLADDSYGDQRVAEKIRNAIQEILPQTSFEKPRYIITKKPLEYFLMSSFLDDCPLIICLEQKRDGQYKALIEVKPEHAGEIYKKLFLTIPDAHFCGYKDHITLHTTAVRSIKVEGEDFHESSLALPFDEVKENTLFFRGRAIAEIDADWKLTLARSENKKRYRFVSVCYPDSEQRFDYLCDVPDIEIGQKIPICDKEGTFESTVVGIIEKTDSEIPLPLSHYHKITARLRFIDR